MAVVGPTVYADSLPAIPLQTPIVQDDRLETNCYLYAQSLIPNLPHTYDIIPNSIFPNLGGLVILDYNGVTHYVVVKEVLENGIWIKESNFGGSGIQERFLTWEDLEKHQAKYWHALES